MCMSTIEKTQKKESSGNGIEEININTIQNVKMKWQKRLCVIPIMLMLWDAHFFFAFETQLFRERDWSVRIPVCGAVDVWMELREEKGGAR